VSAVGGSPVVQCPVRRWRDGQWEATQDSVAEESPVALLFNSIPHVVMMATPADLEDLGVGFSLSEGLLEHLHELREVVAVPTDQGHELRLSVTQERLAVLLARRRNLTGRTGCGVCGAETIADAIRPQPAVPPGGHIGHRQLAKALAALRAAQPWGGQTGSLHAAAWVNWLGEIELVREDVGRHNALDKVIGARLRQGLDFQSGLALITSRASYEMVQKAAQLGIRMLVAVSAPTALAIRLAQTTGITLVGFAREHQQVIYTHPERLA